MRMRPPVQKAGAGGRAYIVRFNVEGLDGSGPDGEVMFHDLWTRRPDGLLVPKHPERILQSAEAPNMILRRGLSAMMWYPLLWAYPDAGRSASDVQPSEITYGGATLSGTTATNLPFVAFVMLADYTALPADALVEWNESDSQYNAKIPDKPGATFATGEGWRAVLKSETSGPDIYLAGTAYPTTAPYREAEFTFYAGSQISSYVQADGYVEVGTNPADGESFTLDDGINPAVTFEFDNNSSWTQGNVPVTIGAGTTDTRDEIVAAINAIGDKLYIAANPHISNPDRVELTHTAGGTVGNNAIVDGTGGDLTVNGMSGGTGPETGDREIDNLPIKAVAWCHDRPCGGQGGESEGQYGARAIVGLAPTAQGYCDRGYVHEFLSYDSGTGTETEMKDYSSSGTMADNLDGYVQSSAAADAYLADFTGSITVDTVNKRITVDSTELDIDEHIGFRADLHERKWIKLVGGGYGPDGIAMRIKRVISNRQVEVFPTPAGEPDSNDATDGYLMEKYDATHAFDSSVEWEGIVKADAARSDTPGQLILGEKWVSADNANLKKLGRIFKWNGGSGAKVVTGIRLVGAPGVSKDFYVDEFEVQYLDTVTYGSGATPSNDAHWVSINIGAAALQTSQADNIYGGGQYGYEYIFDTPTPACGGIRIVNVKAFDDTRKAEVSMMAVFTAGTSIDMSGGAVLRLSKDNGTSWIPFDIEAVGPTTDYTEVEDAINREVVGFEYEAVRSELGYLWVRRTVAGDNSDLDLDSEDNESTASTACGFTSTSSETRHEDGVTQVVTKLTKDALTIIYRFVMEGDIPGAS